jgi:hypothetical protein
MQTFQRKWLDCIGMFQWLLPIRITERKEVTDLLPSQEELKVKMRQ